MSQAKALLTPFDVMRTTRSLAPSNPKLNDRRWATGEALRRVHERTLLTLRSPQAGAPRSSGFGPRDGLPATEIALHAHERLRQCEGIAGVAAWPILFRIVIEGGDVRACRGFVPDVVTPWRVDAIVTDRLRVALDRIGPTLGLRGD